VSNLAELHRLEGRYSEAETLLRRALALGEQALGPEHPAVATRLLILAALYGNQGRYAESEQLYRRALAIREKALGAEHSDVAQSLNNLAAFFFGQGRYADAEPLYRRALAIYEKTLGPDHSSFGNSLQNLASVYLEQGRYAQAEPLFVRAVANAEKALGPEHPNLAQRLNSLASLYRLRGRHAQAEPLYRRALAIREKVLGPDHPDVANTLNTLGILNLTQRRYAEAEPQFQRALSIQEKALGAEHPDVGNTLSNLALLYRAQEKNQEVEPLYLRALAIREKTRGPDHPSVSVNLSNLASFYEDQGRVEEALKAVRRVTATLVKRFGGTDGGERRGALGEQRTRSGFFEQHVRLLAALTEKTPQDRINAAAESFTAAQLARASDTAEQVANMAARYAAGSGALASLARARQDALGQLERIDARVLQAMSRPRNARSAGAEAQLREEEKTARAALAELDEQLTREYPAYRELTDPRPLELPAAQKLLAPDEALVLLLIASNLTLRAGERTFLWVLRHDRAEFFNLPVKRAELVDAVKKLRTQLDLGAGDPERILAVPFDVAGAHELYRRILAPAEALLGGARQLIFVPDGPLSSLPPWVLVTDPPARPIASLGEHAQVAWLAKRHAITILPAVSSLRALRQFAKSPVSDEPFRGFGDPLLEGKGPAARGVNISALFSRGSVADVDEVKKLARLPESADELRAIAKALKASPEAVLLGEQATERAVKEGNLARFRTLAFATHGLMAGEFKGLAEPALVLTPPVQGTALDDGLLTASEIAQLRLDADWVVLSACNTAAPDGTPGAEGLSGLARAFFYAGARSLLVSHWAVSSDATVALTTRMFEETAKGAPKAEALRRSMLALMEQSQRPHFAHPAFWAPFVVVGEGNDHWSKAGASGKRQP
jgi:CHAT domain-containing protein/Tfp pilus assembly protein PilF